MGTLEVTYKLLPGKWMKYNFREGKFRVVLLWTMELYLFVWGLIHIYIYYIYFIICLDLLFMCTTFLLSLDHLFSSLFKAKHRENDCCRCLSVPRKNAKARKSKTNVDVEACLYHLWRPVSENEGTHQQASLKYNIFIILSLRHISICVYIYICVYVVFP